VVSGETQLAISNIEFSNLEYMSKKIDFLKSIKDLGETDLTARIKEDELRLKKLKFAHTISPLENPMTLRGLRKELARLKTELRKRELSI
jgi:large subunit ribosomal protein L29